MRNVEKLMNTPTPFLTDGGFETWMFFVDGFEAPEFSALMLMDDAEARAAMRDNFDRYLAIAADAGTGFVLDTATWRGCISWTAKLDTTAGDLLRLSRDAVAFAVETRDAWSPRVQPIVVNGVIGPVGDGYDATTAPDAASAEALHTPQIKTMVDAGAEMISAITMTNTAEAIGVVRAARDAGAPVVISFTVETDGRLPSGETLADAIARTDAATGGEPLYYMVNCAHPDHFRGAMETGEDWLSRIGGLRANASRMSHEELDNSETLDDGNPVEFGQLHAEMTPLFPNLRVVGGCCGTDHRHVGCVSDHLHKKIAA
ncbi:MAG: homocysteine S-methyltransferase family protein [Magnetovibrio sp.]|nr:homocysteine S-methyltransferase family protein [Magnetovibrio sp.]